MASRAERARAGLLFAAGLAVAGAAAAREFVYRCEDHTELRANFTPDRVHLKRGDQAWTLARVRAVGAARYTHRAAGLELVAVRKDVVLIERGQETRCAFSVQP